MPFQIKSGMRLFLISAIILLAVSSRASQNQFLLTSPFGKQRVQVNGIKYLIDSIGTRIVTNYPKFDTLCFLSQGPRLIEPILCNFKPDSSYCIAPACCGSLDIIPMSKLVNDSLRFWKLETDLPKIQKQLMDKPYISIRTKPSPKDSVYAWHSDAACKTEYKLITDDLWRLGVPPKCFYWSNVTTIQFFKIDNSLPAHEVTDFEEFLGIKNIVELTSISFRLFDNERFVLIYDESINSVTLEYE
jgi:hypothetical protein